jgi:hypothetical protein
LKFGYVSRSVHEFINAFGTKKADRINRPAWMLVKRAVQRSRRSRLRAAAA